MDLVSRSMLDMLRQLLPQAPPWLVLSALVGVVCAASFYVLAGRGLRSLPTYLALGTAVAPLSQIVGSNMLLPPGPLMVGEVNLLVVAIGTWLLLAVARVLRL